MLKYEYKNPFWLYEDNRMWPRILKALPKILIVLAIGAILVLIADSSDKRVQKYRETKIDANSLR